MLLTQVISYLRTEEEEEEEDNDVSLIFRSFSLDIIDIIIMQ